MKCKECKGKMVPEMGKDVLGKHYYWVCKPCDRKIEVKVLKQGQ